ncbi:hypothetical protein IQ260_07805 [Leptolyngbya cf. ectocarpi LEGE 11479]|uniref:Uncharacterized protein n=1 Tax=Leptolyngbya cf. ectocarpi LEGE 11479 TaxID=1828722 RepID=A0A928ZTP5_LEPEC|nr:hypothetical protein [Leptolyngbya ectocarpi]MBE9066554.1 hypothetical protein [Leptolyngbya cf. ectocarpi LEGE 11479]
MTTRQNFPQPPKPLRLLWLTFDFSKCLSDTTDNITPQLFIILMSHPAINQIKRFTSQADNLGPDDVAQWEPGIFTVQAHRSSLLDVLTQVTSNLASHIADHEQTTITIYTQLGGRHYPITSSLSSSTLTDTATEIEALVQHYEDGKIN